MPSAYGAPTLEEALSAPSPWRDFNQTMQSSLASYNAQQQAMQNELNMARQKGLLELQLQMMNPLNRVIMGGKVAEAYKNAGIDIPPSLASFMGGDIPGGGIASAVSQGGSSSFGVPSSLGGQAVTQSGTAPASNDGLVATEFGRTPFGTFRANKLENPAAIAKLKAVGEYGGKMGEAQSSADISSIRDTAQLSQTAQSLKNLISLHKDLTDAGLAGSGPQGFIANHFGVVPTWGGLQNAVVSPDNQNKIGQFVSARTESLVKMQPQLSQQFGQDGSVRIMDSLLNLAGQEMPDLSTPNAKAQGQVAGTLRSLYVIKKAGDQYAQMLKEQGIQMPNNPDDYVKNVAPLVYQIKTSLTPEEESELQKIQDDVLGKVQTQGKKFGSIGAQDLQKPSNNQPRKLDVNTAKQLLMRAGGDKNKARDMAKQMGYSF